MLLRCIWMTKTTHHDMHEGSLLHKKKSNFCLLCQYLFNLFAQSFCKGSQLATRLPRSRATTCQNTGRAFNPSRSNSNWQNQVYDLEQDPCTVLGLHQTIAGIAQQINENLDHLWSFYLGHSVSQLSNMSISYFWSNIILGHTDCALGVRNSLEMNLLKVVITIRPPFLKVIRRMILNRHIAPSINHFWDWNSLNVITIQVENMSTNYE